jgi:hypothetical protein
MRENKKNTPHISSYYKEIARTKKMAIKQLLAQAAMDFWCPVTLSWEAGVCGIVDGNGEQIASLTEAEYYNLRDKVFGK